jgi:hypothetical protein
MFQRLNQQLRFAPDAQKNAQYLIKAVLQQVPPLCPPASVDC